MRWFLLALLIIPALEIGVFIWLGDYIGPWSVVLLIILTGFAGVSLARHQGYETLLEARKLIAQRQVPTFPIIAAVCIFIGAALLIVPGFITDIIGLLLLIPFTRRLFSYWVYRFIKKKINKGNIIYYD